MGWREFLGLQRTALPATRAHARREPVLGPSYVRSFLAASTDRLTADLTPFSTPRSINAELRSGLATMRARSRYLTRSNDHGKAFLRLVRRNIVGAYGIDLQMQAMTRTGKLDRDANARIEEAYGAWSRPGVCTMDGLLSRADMERLLIQTVATDGEALVRLVPGADNKFRFSVQLFDADMLPEALNVPAGNAFADEGYRLPIGNEIVMGVERNAAQRPVAYWLRQRSSATDFTTISSGYRRVPAGEMLHVFVPEFIGQARGIPWMFSGMRRLALLSGYEEAELVAARTASSKMGFFTRKDNDSEMGADGKDAEGVNITDAQPGTFEQLPAGVEFQPYDPQHPAGNYGPYVKSLLRAIASGSGVSYHSLTGDLEGANYSSLRQGALDERDEWRVMQQWFIDRSARPIFEAWLGEALGFGALDGLNPLEAERWNKPLFVPRGWQWVDPSKEIDADTKAVGLGVKTRRMICAERGLDFDQVVEQLAAEAALAKEKGIDISGGLAPPQAAAPGAGDINDTEDDNGDQGNSDRSVAQDRSARARRGKRG